MKKNYLKMWIALLSGGLMFATVAQAQYDEDEWFDDDTTIVEDDARWFEDEEPWDPQAEWTEGEGVLAENEEDWEWFETSFFDDTYSYEYGYDYDYVDGDFWSETDWEDDDWWEEGM